MTTEEELRQEELKKLADFMHETCCTEPHSGDDAIQFGTDYMQCTWGYEGDDWTRLEHSLWLGNAKATLKFIENSTTLTDN